MGGEGLSVAIQDLPSGFTISHSEGLFDWGDNSASDMHAGQACQLRFDPQTHTKGWVWWYVLIIVSGQVPRGSLWPAGLACLASSSPRRNCLIAQGG